MEKPTFKVSFGKNKKSAHAKRVAENAKKAKKKPAKRPKK